MDNDNKKINIQEKLIIENRQKLFINGVVQVISIKDDLLQIQTQDGGLVVAGIDLKIEKLNLDSGELSVDGRVNSLKYGNAKKESFLRKIFK